MLIKYPGEYNICPIDWSICHYIQEALEVQTIPSTETKE